MFDVKVNTTFESTEKPTITRFKKLINFSKNFQKRVKSGKPIVIKDLEDTKPILKKSEEKSWNKKPKDEKWSKKKSVSFDPNVQVGKFIRLSSVFTSANPCASSFYNNPFVM